ncbi:type II secretion system F family protein [Herminiimonas sp.]|uniref:type II secretion system F family protein n=1 Tax=Herminiimonas sp. TaxID=1926289 RepID=UPI002716BC15|nr:type II secretion system F family protein [Herminiimonas sp.]MDO8305304.1 type II secretion system F family protein [Herminiimonas sp.]
MTSLGLILAIGLLAAFLLIWVALQGVRSILAKQRSELETSTKTTLADMFIFLDAAQIFYYNVAALILLPTLVWLFTSNPVFVTFTAIATLVLPKYYIKSLGTKRLKRFEEQLPDALLMVSGAMRAGASLNVAMESMVKEQKPPLSQEFELMLREQRLGVDFDTALVNMEKRNPLQDFSLVVSGLRISREVGGNLAEILESLSTTLREKATMEGKIRSLTAQGKMQGIIMSCLPLLMMAALNWIEPKAMGAMFTTAFGWATLSVILVMITIGYLFIRKITTIDV